MSSDALYEVAYAETVRALVDQQAVIESFRTRAGLLFSAAAVTTSFLGAQAFTGGDSNLTSWLALLCFIAVAGASLAILWPRRWEGAASPREVIKAYVESGQLASVGELHRDLAICLHGSYVENREGPSNLPRSSRSPVAY